ncbi:MAG TPA: glycosyltransferase family 2 protein [Burkholderiaceae bacterium]|jgi:choline kinase
METEHNAALPWTFVITMAGMGSRFRKAGFDLPKYMIETCGKSLFEWSLTGLLDLKRNGDRFVFIARAEDNARDFIGVRCAAMGIENFQVVEIDAPTDGQATTATLALATIPADQPMAIFNIDTGLVPGALRRADATGEGWIPCFRAPGEGWSFCRADAGGRVLEVREKSRISEFATIGFYWFSSAALFGNSYANYYAVAGREEKGERYVAPLYNEIILAGGLVTLSEVAMSAVIPLGTPEEVRQFESGRVEEKRKQSAS